MKRRLIYWVVLAVSFLGMAFLSSCEKEDAQPSYLLTVSSEPIGFMVDSIIFTNFAVSVGYAAFEPDSIARVTLQGIQQAGHYAARVKCNYRTYEFGGYQFVDFDLIFSSTTARPKYIIIHSPLGRRQYEF